MVGSELIPPQQQTLANEVVFTGVGLHSGEPTRVVVSPAPPDYGLAFITRGQRIPALAEYVGDTTRCTSLQCGSAAIYTVEHLLAALYGLGIDNAEILVEGSEIPAMDGSALPFAHALLATGVVSQGLPPREVRLAGTIWVQDGERHVVARPDDTLQVAAAVDFNRPFAGPQFFGCSLGGPQRPFQALELVGAAGDGLGSRLPPLRQPALEGGTSLHVFLEELAPARTFCFEDWIAAIRAAGLGSGGTLDNTLVLSNTGTSTPLRFPDELARHKALDLLGDLALVGGRLRASVIAIKAGHSLHVAAAREIRRMAHAVEYPGD